jgi:ketosteroid isomerase-like protein
MHPNEVLIHAFYQAFQKKDFRAMQQAYHADAAFSDPVFPNLSSREVKAMWEMLLTSARDLEITYSGVSADGEKGGCHWEARYTFSGTGRKVHNVIEAKMRFRDGKILQHVDHFDFWRWSRMALGRPGIFLGWSSYLKNAVQAKVRKRLEGYMAESPQKS